MSGERPHVTAFPAGHPRNAETILGPAYAYADVDTLGRRVYRHTPTPRPDPLSASLIGARIKRARKALGWSPGRAADTARVPVAHYRQIEAGEAIATADLTGIAAAFGVPLSDLTGTRA